MVRPTEQANQRVVIRCLIPSRHAGGIIGKGGVSIMMIRDRSGASVEIAGNGDIPFGFRRAPSDHRIATFSGNVTAVGGWWADRQPKSLGRLLIASDTTAMPPT